MFWPRNIALAAVAALSISSSALANEFGRTATPEEIKLWDIDVRPDGKGLPEGSGMVAQGKSVYTDNCAACHGVNGQGGIKDRLVGGQGTHPSDKPIKTVGSYWPYATTLFDYVRRAMPLQAPQSLTDDQVYAVVAYLLSIDKIVPDSATLDAAGVKAIQMPNRDGFIAWPSNE